MEYKQDLNIINKELEECLECVSHHYKQIKWFVQSYFFAFAALFSIATFYAQGEREILLSIVGVTFGIAVYMFGWFLLSALARRVASIYYIHKQIALFRNCRYNLLSSYCRDSLLTQNNKEKYVFPRNMNLVTLPGLIFYLPYAFFALNYAVLIGSICYFTWSQFDRGEISIILSFTIGTTFGIFYPNACVTFNKHLKGVIKHDTYEERSIYEREWKKLRKERFIGRVFGSSLLVISDIVLIGIFMWSLESTRWNGLFTPLFWSVIVAIIFVVARLLVEPGIGQRMVRALKSNDNR